MKLERCQIKHLLDKNFDNRPDILDYFENQMSQAMKDDWNKKKINPDDYEQPKLFEYATGKRCLRVISEGYGNYYDGWEICCIAYPKGK